MLSQTHKLSQKLRSKNAPPVEIRDLERAILRAVHRYRLLEWRQIEDLFAASVPDTKYLAERVELLYRNVYLEEVPRDKGNGRVYRLASAGALLLSGQENLPFTAFHYFGKGDDKDRRKTEISSLFLEHSLELADIRIAIERSAARNTCTIEAWHDEAALRKGNNWPRIGVTTIKGFQEVVPLIPDHHFVLRSPHGRAHIFVECDRSTESIAKRWQRKILAYKTFILSGEFSKRYTTPSGTAPVRILTTTKSQSRAYNLKMAAEQYGPNEASSLFLFTPLSELISYDALLSPIWLRGGTAQAHSIL